MATVYGVNATKRDVNVPSEKLPPGEERGRVRCAYDEYAAPTVIATGEVIKFMKLPSGARVVDVTVKHGDLDTLTNANYELGWDANGVDAADPNGFITSTSLQAAGNDKPQANVPGLHKSFGAETQVSMLTTGATDTAGTISVTVFYILD